MLSPALVARTYAPVSVRTFVSVVGALLEGCGVMLAGIRGMITVVGASAFRPGMQRRSRRVGAGKREAHSHL